VVFETDQRAGRDVLELSINDDVADEALLAGFRSHVDEADTREPLAFGRLVVVAEELVTAADREHRRAGLYRAFERRLLVLE